MWTILGWMVAAGVGFCLFEHSLVKELRRAKESEYDIRTRMCKVFDATQQVPVSKRVRLRVVTSDATTWRHGNNELRPKQEETK